MNLSNLGVEENGSRISVGQNRKTNIKGIFAVGDVVGEDCTRATFMGETIAVENILWKVHTINRRLIRRCIYVASEIVCGGLTEEQAKEQRCNVKVGKFPFTGSTKASEKKGLTRVIAEVKSGEILSVDVNDQRAVDITVEAILAMKFGITADDVANVIHAHPTLSEAVREATFTVYYRSMHLPRT